MNYAFNAKAQRGIGMTLERFIHEHYVPSRLGIRPESVRQMEISVRLLDRWAGRQVNVSELSDQLIRSFLSDYLKTASAATVNAKRRQLLALWRAAADDGLVDRRPGRIARAPENLAEPEAWTLDQVTAILRVAKDLPGRVGDLPAREWWPSLLLVVYDTGERIGAVRQTLTRDVLLDWPGVLFRTRKQHTHRWQPISDQAADACRSIWSDDRRLMWPWPKSREWLEHSFRRILTTAGVPHGRDRGGLFHKLRRTSGSLVEASGGDGARHLGNTRAVFERHYRDPRICGGGQLRYLPRPAV